MEENGKMNKLAVSSCYCCGKPLSDPISVSLGIGPVCRAKIKINGMNDKNENLFSNRAIYDYNIDERRKIIAINDLGTVEKSVTNDIENVIADLINNGIDVNQYNIIYRDSMKIWDGIHTRDGKFKDFYSINETDFEKACLKIKI